MKTIIADAVCTLTESFNDLNSRSKEQSIVVVSAIDSMGESGKGGETGSPSRNSSLKLQPPHLAVLLSIW